ANTRNNPVEDIESHLPLRVNRYELRADVIGAGQWRGGLGAVREFEFLADGGISVEGDGHVQRPWGFVGGSDGQPAALCAYRADGGSEALPSKLPYRTAKAGDRFEALGPAGGGYGNPFEREPERVRADVLDGLISRATAKTAFGVVLTDALEVDRAATESQRAARPPA
ncbi:MAG: hydantoinase B/oxoprolinase family protein, partial [Geminicoccaceae bacterium]